MIKHHCRNSFLTCVAALALGIISAAVPAQENREQRLADLGARVDSEQVGAHGRSIELQGSRLGKLDTSIDPENKSLVEAEVRRYLATVEDLVGPVGGLQLGKFTLRHEPADNGAVDSVDVSFRQLVHDTPVGSGLLAAAGDKVVRVRITLVDPDQPSLERANWKTEDAAEARAKQEITRHLSLDSVDAARFNGPGLSLRIVDDAFSVKPVYEYRYDRYGIHVDAQTLETVVDDRPAIPAS